MSNTTISSNTRASGPSNSAAPGGGRPGPSMPGVGGGGGSPSAFASIDPVRLLRRHWPLLFVSVIVGAAAGFGANYLLAKYRPSYTANVTYLMTPAFKEVTNLTPETGDGRDLDRFMMTEANQMTSDEVLGKAVQSPQVIATKWANQYKNERGEMQTTKAIEGLGKQVRAGQVGSTSLVSLTMTWRDPESTAVVANAVSAAYLDTLKLRDSAKQLGIRESLNKRLNEIDQQLSTLKSQRERIIRENSIENLRGATSTEDTKMASITQQLLGLQQDMATAQSILDRYSRMLENQSAIVYPDELRQEAQMDPVVRQFESAIASMKTEERALSNRGYGPNHPDMTAIRERIAASEQEMQNHLETAMHKLFLARIDTMKTELDSLAASQEKLLGEKGETAKRREDLVRITVRLDEIEQTRERLIAEEAEMRAALNNAVMLLEQDVYSRVKMIRAATIPRTMSFPKLAMMMPLGVLLVTGLVGGVILLREVMDQRVKGPQDVGMIPRLKVLGVVPIASEDPTRPASVETCVRDVPTSVISESFRQLRSPVHKKMEQAGHRTLLVLAAMPGSGATTTVSNLASAAATAGERVLIIDANMRRPGIHKVFGLGEGPGLGEVLAGEADLASVIQGTTMANLSVVTAGSWASRAVPERLAGETMSRVLNQAAAAYDLVVVDSAPAIVAGDGMALANRCDAAIMVVKAMSEKRGLAARVRTMLEESHAELLGVVVNAVRSSAGGYFKRNIQATHEYQTAKK